MASGAIDVADGLTSIAGTGMLGAGAAGLAASPVLSALGPVGFAAGMIAAGNGYTQDHGWFGKDANGNNKNGFGWALDNGKEVGGSVDRALGGGLAGKIGGGIAGGVAGIGSGVGVLGADFAGGLLDSASGIGNLVGSVFGHGDAGSKGVDAATSFIGHGAANLGASVGRGATTLAHDAGNIAGGITSGASKIGGGIASGAKSVVGGVGKALSHLW